MSSEAWAKEDGGACEERDMHGREGAMPVTFRYDGEHGLVRFLVTGPLDIDEYRNVVRQVSTDPAIAWNAPAIWDLRHLDFSLMTPEVLHEIVQIRRGFPERVGTVRIGLVIDQEIHEKVLALFKALLGEGADSFQVFYTIEEAEDWIAGHGDGG